MFCSNCGKEFDTNAVAGILAILGVKVDATKFVR